MRINISHLQVHTLVVNERLADSKIPTHSWYSKIAPRAIDGLSILGLSIPVLKDFEAPFNVVIDSILSFEGDLEAHR